jgi:hypothetical protein
MLWKIVRFRTMCGFPCAALRQTRGPADAKILLSQGVVHRSGYWGMHPMSYRRAILGSALAGAACFAIAPSPTHAAGCTVYQHRDYQGSRWHLNHDDALQVAGEPCGKSVSHGRAGRVHYQPSWNDKISSFKVTLGCTIRLWVHAQGCGGAGATFTSDRSYKYVGSGWNDKTSFVECHCKRGSR